MNIRFNKYVIFILMGVLLFSSSCTELEEKSYSNITASEFEPTEKDLIRLIGPAYGELTNIVQGFWNNWSLQVESADLMVTPQRENGWYDGGIYLAMHQHNFNPNSPMVNGCWNSANSGVTNTNKAIYQIESGTIPIEDENKKTKVLAELRALRALYYYILLNNYGNVPIVTDFDVPEGFQPEQSSREDVYNFVKNELTAVMENLPENEQKYYGRMHKWAAKTLLAQLYLNADVYLDSPPSDQYNKVISLTNDVINSGKFSLDSDYRTPFSSNNHTSSNEIIFGIPFDEEKRGWFHLPLRTMNSINQATYDLGSAPWGDGGISAVPQFINTYEENDKRLEKTWLKGVQLTSSGDTLYSDTDGDDEEEPFEYVNRLTAGDKTNGPNEGYRLKKWEIEPGTVYTFGNDWPYYRYAQVLMMNAEAQLRGGTKTSAIGDAATIVTKIRERNFDDPAEAQVTESDLRAGSDYNYGVQEDRDNDNVMEFETQEGGDDIELGGLHDEYAKEFVSEMKRRTQMIRFGVFTTKSWFSHDKANSNPDKTLFPIPQGAISSNPNLEQNPGY